MTPREMEAMVRNLGARTTRIEQILPTLATKQDLENSIRDLATKGDLRAFATKDDLKKFATKNDLKKFATKEDLKRFATKDDLREGLAASLTESKHYTRVLFEDLKSDIRLLAEYLVRVSDVVERLDRRST